MRELVWQGLKDLTRARLATATAGLAALAAALAVETSLRNAAGAPSGFAWALGVVFMGASLSSLLGSCARSLALTAYAQPGRPWLGAGFSHVPALVTIAAFEITIDGSLLLCAALLLPRAVAAHSVLMGVLICAPPLALAVLMFAAARVALVLAVRGVAPSRALMHGFDVVLRRLPSLVRLGGALSAYTLPLTVSAVMLGVGSLFAVASPATALARALAFMLLELTALWSYAALANLVGRDPRLVTG